MRSRHPLPWLSIALLCLHGSIALSRSEQPVPLELLQQRETILSSDLSPSGDWVAVIVTQTYRQTDAGSSATKAGTNSLRLIHTRRGSIHAPVPDLQTNVVAWSPDGTWLALDVETDRGRELALFNTRSATLRTLPNVLLSRGNLAWSADGQTLFATLQSTGNAAVKSTDPESHARSAVTVTLYRGSATQGPPGIASYDSDDFFRGDVARIDPRSGASARLTAGLRPQSMRLSADGRWIAFATLRGRSNGNGYRHLFDLSIVASDGSTPVRTVTTDVESMSTLLDFSWSPNGRYLAYSAGTLAAEGVARNCYIVNVATGERRLVHAAGADTQPALGMATRVPLWDATGRSLYLLGDRGLWRADVDTATARLLASIPNRSIRQILAPRDDAVVRAWAHGHALLLATRDDETKSEGIYQVDLSSGNTRRLREGPVALSSAPRKIDVSSDGDVIVYAQESADRSEQLWVGDARLRNARQLTRLNPQLDAYPFGKSRLLSWHTSEGRRLQGALLLPAGFVPGTRCPLIVESYPGDRLSDGLNLFGGPSGFATLLQNTQTLATRGYCVLSVDTSSAAATPMRAIASSVLPAIDETIRQGIADPRRLGVKGQSSGGYAAMSLIVQTDRFKAAVVTAGFANLFGMHSQMHRDGAHWGASWAERPDNMDGTPWERRERYIENSPYFFLDRVQTPVLLIHGEQDTAVSAHLADELYVSLRRLHKEVMYAKYAGEGHLLLQRANGLDAAERMIAWFDEHLGLTRP